MKKFLMINVKWRIIDILLFSSIPIYLFLSFLFLLHFKIKDSNIVVYWMLYLIIILLPKMFKIGKLSNWIIKQVNVKMWVVCIYFILFLLSSISFLLIN